MALVLLKLLTVIKCIPVLNINLYVLMVLVALPWTIARLKTHALQKVRYVVWMAAVPQAHFHVQILVALQNVRVIMSVVLMVIAPVAILLAQLDVLVVLSLGVSTVLAVVLSARVLV